MTAVVIINSHEPEHEVATRLLELAEEKGYDPTVVVAQRGEHDSALSFRVPEDVAEGFEGDRSDRWPTKIENDGEKAAEQPTGYIAGDAYAADNLRRAADARAYNAVAANENNQQTPTTSRREQRPGKAQAQKE